MRVYIFVRLVVVASQKCEIAQNSEKILTYSSSRSSKVIDIGANRKRIYLMMEIHRFWDTATYWLKISYFSYPSHSAPPLPMLPLEFRGEVNHEETVVMELLCGESCMILTSTVFDWSTHVRDIQQDRRTDGRTIAYSAL